MRKNFIVVNKGFVCAKCGHENPPLSGGCRNHCRECLWSAHADDAIPGDRASDCHGFMAPVSLDYSGKKGYIVLHECLACGKRMKNKSAADDSHDAIMRLGILSQFKL